MHAHHWTTSVHKLCTHFQHATVINMTSSESELLLSHITSPHISLSCWRHLTHSLPQRNSNGTCHLTVT